MNRANGRRRPPVVARPCASSTLGVLRDFPQWGVRVPAAAPLRFWAMFSHYRAQIRNPWESARVPGVNPSTTRRYLDETPSPAGWEMPIAGYFVKENDAAAYEYDFGDEWRHTITLEGIDELRKGERGLACLGGERRCPPEDCGGIPGYEDPLDILADVTHEERDAMPRWLGGTYDPEAFSAALVKFDGPKVRWRNAFLEPD